MIKLRSEAKFDALIENSDCRGACFLDLGGDAPAAPDYTPMAAASKEAAEVGAQLGREQLAESRRQYDTNIAVAKPVADAQLNLMRQTGAQGDDYYDYMRSRQRPVEDLLSAEALGLNPDQVAQLNKIRADEDAAARSAYEAAVAKAQSDATAQTASAPSTYTTQIDVPTLTQQAPPGTTLGADLPPNWWGQRIDPAKYYATDAEGRYVEVAPTYVQGTTKQDINIPLPGGTVAPSGGTSVARPVTDRSASSKFMTEAGAAGLERKQEDAASLAKADARQGTTRAQNQLIRQGMRYGLTPAALASRATSMAATQGLAEASAGNAAREKERTTQYAKKMDIAGLYRGTPGASQGAYGLALQSGDSAVRNTMAPGQALINGMSAANGTTMQGQGMQLQGLGNVLSAQTSYANANQGGDGLSGLGTLIGAGTKAYQVFSCEDLKEDKEPIDAEFVVEKIEKMPPVEAWKYKDGVEDSGHHIGPYAGDMHAAFGDKVAPGAAGLDLVSANGINMAAIQGLAKKMRKLEGRVAGLALKKADRETSNGLI